MNKHYLECLNVLVSSEQDVKLIRVSYDLILNIHLLVYNCYN